MSRHPISAVEDKVDFTLNVAGIKVLSQVGSNPSFLTTFRFTLSGIPIAFNAVSCTFVIVLSSSHNRSLKLLRLFTNARQALQMLFAGKMEKERSSINSLGTVHFLSGGGGGWWFLQGGHQKK